MTDKEYMDAAAQMAGNLLRDFQAGVAEAKSRAASAAAEKQPFNLNHARDIVAREEGFEDWTEFSDACANGSANRRRMVRRLRIALFYGQNWKADELLAADPALAHADLGIEIAMRDANTVLARINEDAAAATRPIAKRRPIIHLCFSRFRQPDAGADSAALAIAEALVANGADVNESFPWDPGSTHRLSALYGAIGHAGNLPLARWLLENGADPNDNESLYHSTELGHSDGVRLLLAFGAQVDGTNALLRALDFNDHESARLLLEHGGSPNAPADSHPSGEPAMAAPALHQAARRFCDREMARLLLAAGADPQLAFDGHSAYAIARIFGNVAFADELAAQGCPTQLDPHESLLAQVADGEFPDGAVINRRALTGETGNLLANLMPRPERLSHAQRLVALGFDSNAEDPMGATPLHLAGWEGLPDTMQWLLTLEPDLEHVNGYGGNLLSTIIHGSENCPKRSLRRHIQCAELALQAGVRLSTRAVDLAGEENMARFLRNWAKSHPDQVVEGGIG